MNWFDALCASSFLGKKQGYSEQQRLTMQMAMMDTSTASARKRGKLKSPPPVDLNSPKFARVIPVLDSNGKLVNLKNDDHLTLYESSCFGAMIQRKIENGEPFEYVLSEYPPMT